MRQSHFKKPLLAITLALSTFAASPSAFASDSHYGGAQRQNAEGRQACNALLSQGGSFWEAKVRGRFESGSGGNINRFTVRNCFKSRSNCETYVRRIGNIIYPIEQIYYARCKALS